MEGWSSCSKKVQAAPAEGFTYQEAACTAITALQVGSCPVCVRARGGVPVVVVVGRRSSRQHQLRASHIRSQLAHPPQHCRWVRRRRLQAEWQTLYV